MRLLASWIVLLGISSSSSSYRLSRHYIYALNSRMKSIKSYFTTKSDKPNDIVHPKASEIPASVGHAPNTLSSNNNEAGGSISTKRPLDDLLSSDQKKLKLVDTDYKSQQPIDTPNSDNSLNNDKNKIALSASVIESKSKAVESEWPQLSYLEESWKTRLSTEFSKSYFKKLQEFVDSEASSNTVYPPMDKIFTAFRLCPFDNVKVVIIGQDPYHGPNQAHGLAFSVEKGVRNPPSLHNIFLEAMSDVKISEPKHGNLECWSKQGVFLLNTCLTVRKGDANSHQKRGWETFTDAVVRELNKKEGIVYLLWGIPASTKCASINRSKNTIITSSHPSPLGAYKTDKPFMGSKCFSKCNEALIAYGKDPIDWSVK